MTKAHSSLFTSLKVNHMQPICPNCQSSNVATLNKARKIGGTVGAAIGAINGAKAAANNGMVSVIATATMGAISGGIAGCIAGSTLGATLDDEILDNFQCLSCGHTFNRQVNN